MNDPFGRPSADAWFKGCVLVFDEVAASPTPALMPTLFPKFPCGSHPSREAIYSNECNALTSHKWAIWYYCEECGEHFLTARGRSHYRLEV